jgi:hypothetical protein
MENVPCFGTYPSLSAAYRRARNLVVAMHCYRLFVSVPTDINEKNRVLDQITACHHPQTAPTDCFLYTRASASMAGAKRSCARYLLFKGAQWTFSPALSPTPPRHLNFATPATRRRPCTAVSASLSMQARVRETQTVPGKLVLEPSSSSN